MYVAQQGQARTGRCADFSTVTSANNAVANHTSSPVWCTAWLLVVWLLRHLCSWEGLEAGPQQRHEGPVSRCNHRNNNTAGTMRAFMFSVRVGGQLTKFREGLTYAEPAEPCRDAIMLSGCFCSPRGRHASNAVRAVVIQLSCQAWRQRVSCWCERQAHLQQQLSAASCRPLHNQQATQGLKLDFW